MSQLGRLERLAWLTIGFVIAGCLVWQTVSGELSRRQTREFMEMSLHASMGDEIVVSEVVREVPVEVLREVPVERVPVRAIPGSDEIVTSKVTNIVPPDVTDPTPPDLCESVDLTGVGFGNEVRDLAPGVYTATIHGDTFALDVTMESVDGRSRFNWGRTASVSSAVGDHADAALFVGPTRITVSPPGPDVRWGIVIERLDSESDATPIRVEVVGDEAAIADLSPGLWRVDLVWTSGDRPANWVWDASIESVAGFGGGPWGGGCTVIHVGPSANQPFSGIRLDPGEVAVTANVPPDFTWAVAFTPFPTGADDDGECLW
ncbi:MAG: hypothetical protein OXG33_04420 [Chloroflexi bacterium]|nr:hypothetical protein [Chloroflexota bacterium]